MATAVSACESKNTRKPASPFSKSEIEAAKQLIQLSSSGDEEEDGDYHLSHHHHSISNNSCSYSVVQGNNNSGGDVVSSALADDEENESCLLPRRNNKRYRFLEDLYSVTVPVIVKSKRKKTSIKTKNS
ncbi:hypothetical protein PIB30_053080 [Stylosanthes scabra]|uniref:Uncharacterized protein n=1 Tax=Stylosanthes scabra TaxID=79078 RepID=A0ABU6YJ04_9FABA|nr:hypothetical protein [Stylosanthes scabra]